MNEMLTISKLEYEKLCAAAEDLTDLKAYDTATAMLADSAEELIPAEFVNRLLNGHSPLKVYREIRGYTQAQLAQLAEVNRTTIGEIKIGRKQGSVATLSRLANLLDITIDDLV
jgi:DNA-binding XRE family transcriptional regulator